MKHVCSLLALCALATTVLADTSGIQCPDPGDRRSDLKVFLSDRGYTLGTQTRTSLGEPWSLTVDEVLTADEVAELEGQLQAQFGNTAAAVSLAQAADASVTPIVDLDSFAATNIRHSSQTVATTGGVGFVDATDLIPADCLLLGVTARVQTAITGPGSWNLGISGGDTDLFGSGLLLAENTTVDMANYKADPFAWYTAAATVRLTAIVGNFTAGSVEVTAHYIDLSPPVAD